ncbi:hypothetical protein B0T16DRAFT_457098 [Cercophora newfieldiana]|uniref:C2H2-type domain-containing protein n=1 Tax=Cercophora newfieldiana TaxID=92897 RepID=A0AA39YBR5_9PEZI|nr:hypothetical protein B0T16DRAFT_457098 [Cercophora newfieldiana]
MPSGETLSSAAPPAKNNLTKRKRALSPQELEDDWEDDYRTTIGREARKGPKKPPNPDGVRPWACPFWKFDPSKYRDCFKNGFTRLADMKQHLKKCHFSTYDCSSCSTSFFRETDLREHFDSSKKCGVRSDSFGPSGKNFTYSISKEEWTALNYLGRQSGSRLSGGLLPAEARWNDIWCVLFPNQRIPPSPYVEADFPCGNLFLFYQHLTSAGSEQLSHFFDRQKVSSQSIPPAAIAEFLKSFYHEWRHQQGSTPSLPGHEGESEAHRGEIEAQQVSPALGESIPMNDPRFALTHERANSSDSGLDVYMGAGRGAELWNAAAASFQSLPDEPTISSFRDASPGILATENSASDHFSSTGSSIFTVPSSHGTALSFPSSYGDWGNLGELALGASVSQHNPTFLPHNHEPVLFGGQHSAGPTPSWGDRGQRPTYDMGAEKPQTSQKSGDVDKLFMGNATGLNADGGNRGSPLVVTSGARRFDSSSVVSGDENSSSTDDARSRTSSERTGWSDNFEFDDVLVPDGSRFSPAQSAAVWAIRVAYETASQTTTLCDVTCATLDPTDAHESSPPENTPSDSSGSLTSSGISSLSTGLTSQASPQRGDTIQKRGREEDDEPKKPRRQKRKRIEDGAQRLACPFQKKYPLKHFFCGAKGAMRGFDTIAHIKDHITRRHRRSVIHCPRCKTDFEDSEKLTDHVLRQSCEEQPFPDETALPRSRELDASLNARVDKALTLPEQWFSVWRILFPGTPQPRSCFVDDDVCEHLFEYQQFITSRGHDIVRNVVRSHGLLPDTDASFNEDPACTQRAAAELEAFAQRVFGLAAEAIFHSWVDAHQTRQPALSGRQTQPGGDSPTENKGKARDDSGIASGLTGQTSGPPPVFRGGSTVSTVPATWAVSAGDIAHQRMSQPEATHAAISNETLHHWNNSSSFDAALDRRENQGQGYDIQASNNMNVFSAGGSDTAGGAHLGNDLTDLFGTVDASDAWNSAFGLDMPGFDAN